MGQPKGRTGNPNGRKAGSKNRKTMISDAILAELIKHRKTPLEFLLTVMTNSRVALGYRLDAAKAAAPYVHKKMPVQIEHGGEIGHNHRGGVMVVPAVESTQDWATRASAAQRKLKEEVRH